MIKHGHIIVLVMLVMTIINTYNLEGWVGRLSPYHILGRLSRRKSKKKRGGGGGGGGGAQPYSIAFGGVFPNITEAILVD